MYISAAGKQVSGIWAGQNDNSQCICDKLYSGHARSEQVPQVDDGIWCISPKFKAQIIKTVASMYISAARKQVSGILAGQNDKSQCNCDKMYSGHARRERVPQVDDGIWYISPKFKPQILKIIASMYTSG